MKQSLPAHPAVSRFRARWALARRIVFLNHGSFGACPKPILKLQSELRARMEAEPVQFLWRHFEERLDPARAELARFLGARERDLVFVTNTTSGVNAIVRSFKFRPGDELLTTDHDYNACRNVLVETARRTGAKLIAAEIPFPVRDDDEIVESVLRAVTSRTRLAMIDHVTSHTALILPIERIVRALEERGVDTLVDGAHAPGMVPIDLTSLRPGYYTGNLHKWVCAPKGAAFLWAREDKQEGLQPAVISHGNNRPRRGYTPFQDRFDWAGTFDPTPWLCVGDALRWMAQLLPGGWRELRRRNRDLVIAGRQLLCERLEVAAPCPEKMLGSMATVSLPRRFQGKKTSGKIDAEQLRLYDEFGIEVPLLHIGDRRWFRVSAQIYNSRAEYEYLAAALQTL
jgi:isopenicillin-N epimerase